MPTLRISIRSCLEHVSKGWFNMEETSFEVYQGSKLKKLMELIKFAMQVSCMYCVVWGIFGQALLVNLRGYLYRFEVLFSKCYTS